MTLYSQKQNQRNRDSRLSSINREERKGGISMAPPTLQLSAIIQREDVSTESAPENTSHEPTQDTESPDQCTPAEQALKDSFRQNGSYGPTSLAHAISPGSGVGIGGFEATYFTRSQLYRVHVQGKIQFVDALAGSAGSFTANHTELNALATELNTLPDEVANKIIPYFQWNDANKASKLETFRQRVTESVLIWQEAGLHFEVNDPCWSDVKAFPYFDLDVMEEGTIDPAADHLQVRMFKAPSGSEVDAIDQILIESGENFLASDTEVRAYAGTNMGSSGNTTDENPLNNEMALSSNDVENYPDQERGGNNFLRHSVMFGFGKSSINNSEKANIQSFIGDFVEGDSIAENSQINLQGFASSSGSTEFNTRLVDKRLQAVKRVLTGAGIPEGRITLENRSDMEAEGLAQEAGTQDNEQRVEIRIGSGERQNTVAHEFGHVFGLSDEYPESASPGDDAWHHDTAVRAGIAAGAQMELNDNIISVGNTVRAQHYSTFAWALNQLTSSSIGGKLWVVKNS